MKKSIRFSKVNAKKPVVNYIATTLESHLARGETIFWLLAGGSYISIEVQVAKRLTNNRDLARLTVSLIDERFGPVGHADSNWEQLMQAGFELPGANLVPVLTGKNRKNTQADYANLLSRNLTTNNFALALSGIGIDGHVLGIKPGSPAINTNSMAKIYAWDDYDRLTATAVAMRQLDLIVVYAVGAQKKQQLDNLQKNMSISEQPAQLLKQAPSVIVFNDCVGQIYK